MSGLTAGDAGHVAEPAGGEAQQGGVLLGAVGGDAHQARRREVRHVADDGDHLVVAVGRHGDDLGAELGDDLGDGGERGVGRAGRRREDPDGAAEHRPVGAVEPVELAARHRVAADEARVVDRLGDRALDAADVGDDAVGLGERPLDLVGDGQDGDGDERQLGARVEPGGVDDVASERLVGPARRRRRRR